MADTSTIGYLLKQAQSLLQLRMDEALHPHGLTVSQYSCLFRLSVEPGISASDLARATFVTRQSMTTMLQGLRDRGLVDRAVQAEVGRALAVELTRSGTHLLDAAKVSVDDVERRIVGELGMPQATALEASLRSCVAALE